MQKLFRKASISLFNSGKIDKDTMHNYYMSGKLKRVKSLLKYTIASMIEIGVRRDRVYARELKTFTFFKIIKLF